METAKGITMPINADTVLSPSVHYGEPMTGIYFMTENDQYGRISFENLDSLKVSRGEYLPYPTDRKEEEPYCWVMEIENSNWLKQRYEYEEKYYGYSYEFKGKVNEMLTDFHHYLFTFHDQFVEAIARGFWMEQDNASLYGQPLQAGHPFLELPEVNVERFEAHALTCQFTKNQKSTDQLIANARYCSQILIQFALELEGRASVDHLLLLAYRNGKLISSLRDYFGREVAAFEGVATFEDVKPYLEKNMEKVYERRKAMGK